MRKSTLRCERWLGLGALLTVVVLADAPARADDAAPAPPSPTTDPTLSIPGMPALPSGSLGGPTPPPTAQPRPSGISGSFGGSITFEKVQEDYFITPTIFNQTTIGPVTFGVQVPIRLRVWDRDPQDDGVLRKEDWDEPSDYLRLLRFVEVNLGDEAQKAGIAEAELPALLDRFAATPHVRCRGLMIIPPVGPTEVTRPYFASLRELRDRLAATPREGVTLEHLSMGMSDDFEAAIEEGATLVRVGTAIFGPRPS